MDISTHPRWSHLARRLSAGILLMSLIALALTSQPAAADSHWEVVASGLNNPRGLAIGPDGSLYVAEAGFGGDGACIANPEGGEACYGPSGAITRVMNGEQTQVVTGLPSLAGADGIGATGPTDVSFRGRVGWVVTGLGADPSARDLLGAAGEQFGRLALFLDNGKYQFTADVSAHESVENPDGGNIDSNPYAVQALAGSHTVVADAGANALLEIRKDQVSTLAVFPARMVDAPPFLGLPPGTQIPMESVPNAVVSGPDGAFYVGELTGFPFPVGGGRVYRVVPGEAPEVVAEGFTNIIDLAFGPDGHLYVLEITKNGLLSEDFTGALLRVEADGSLTELASDGLVAPGGLVIDAEGGIYISNFSVFPGAGQVIYIAP